MQKFFFVMRLLDYLIRKALAYQRKQNVLNDKLYTDIQIEQKQAQLLTYNHFHSPSPLLYATRYTWNIIYSLAKMLISHSLLHKSSLKDTAQNKSIRLARFQLHPVL